VARVGKHGKEVWRTIVPGLVFGLGEARAILRDSEDGNLIVAGTLRGPAGLTFAVFKLDANTGTVLWPESVANFPLGVANALTLTSRNTVAVGGMVEGRFALLEFDTSTGTVVSRGSLRDFGEARSVVFDTREGTVIAGGSMRSQADSSGMTVAKFDANGTALWAESFGSDTSGLSSAAAVAVHQESGAIAVGGRLGPSPVVVFTAMLLASDGKEQWRSADIPGAANGVAFAANNVVAVGQFGESSRTVFAVIAFAQDGAEQWRRTFRGTADFGSNSANAFAVDNAKAALFSAGVINDNPTGPDMFAVGLGLDGSDLSSFPGAYTMQLHQSHHAAIGSASWGGRTCCRENLFLGQQLGSSERNRR
jgi:outer membrane protein assembly factor BamB